MFLYLLIQEFQNYLDISSVSQLSEFSYFQKINF